MPSNNREMKKALSELSASGGGSLVHRVVKSKINDGTKVLFIGLGGLGCISVNEIKKVYRKDFEETANVRFLAIDTDNDAMAKIGIDNGGEITNDEMFPIYSPEARNLLTNRPPLVSKYYHSEALAEELAGDGAKATRGVGRVMLSATSKYGALRTILNNIIRDLAGSPATGIVHIVIVAGISGGTGSGTFIDISYMVRILLKEIKAQDENFNAYSYGVFYTPDVQESVPTIGGDPQKWDSVKCNGYASLKDLDYFMNVGSNLENSPPIYKIETQNATFQSSQSIFDRNKVFLISQTGLHSNCEDIVSSTASALMNMFRCGSTNQQTNQETSQSVLSTLCNTHNNLATWEGNNVAKSFNDTTPVDASGIKNCHFPVSMNYNFASIGYNSIYFPRNEMVAYCANKAYIDIIQNKWDKGFNIPQKLINAAASNCHILSSNDLFGIIYSKFVNSEDSLKIQPTDSANYPRRFGFERVGRMTNLDMTIAKAEELPMTKYNNVKNNLNANPAPINDIVTNIVGLVKNTVTDNTNFISNYGPIGALIVLAGDEDHTRIGLLDMLSNHISNYQKYLKAYKDETANKKQKMDAEKQRLATDNSPTDAEIETFVGYCFDYSKAKFKELLFELAFIGICKRIYTEIQRINAQTFEIYVPILEEIKAILQEDSDVFQNSYLQRNGGSAKYRMAYDLNGALARNQLFTEFFNGYVDPAASDSIVKSLMRSIFDVKSREKWQAYSQEPEALADELRNVFKQAIDPLVSGMLEKFMVLVYSDKNNIVKACGGRQQLTIDDINNIWNNMALRTNALNQAAINIVDALAGSSMVKFSLEPTVSAKFSTAVDIVLMAETPNLNQAIINAMVTKYGPNASFLVADNATTSERKTEISMFSLTVPFALPFVYNMKEYAQSYFKAERTSTRYGRHLDEVTEEWQENLPEIYGVDAEDYFVPSKGPNARISDEYRLLEDGVLKNTDKQVYAIIKDAVEYGIKYGYIDDNTGSITLLKENLRNKETLLEIQNKLLELNKNDKHTKHTWVDAARELSIGRMEYLEIIKLTDGIRNDPLKSLVGAKPEYEIELKNIYRVVRGSLSNLKLVTEAKEFFTENHFFHNIINHEMLQEVITTFLRAYGVGLISRTENDGWYVRYNEDTYLNPALKFFDITKRISENFDEPLELYLMISAFSNLFADDSSEVIKGIRRLCEVDERNDYVYPVKLDDIVAKLKNLDKIMIFQNANVSTRNNEILFAYNNSKYSEYYSYPTFYTQPQTIIDNVKAVIDTVEHVQRYTFRLGDTNRTSEQTNTSRTTEQSTTSHTAKPTTTVGAQPPAPDTWTCSCGTANANDARFCNNCGTPKKQEITCPGCGKTNKKDAHFCYFCGTRLDPEPIPQPQTWFCPECGTKSEGKFCTNCGHKKADL